MSMSLFNKRHYVSILLAITMMIIVTIGYLFINSQEKSILQAESQNLLLINHRNRIMLESWITERKDDIQVLVSNPELTHKLYNYTQDIDIKGDKAYITNRLTNYCLYKNYIDAFMVDLNGIILISKDSIETNRKVILNNDWKTALLAKDVVMGDIKNSEVHPNEIVLDFFIPIYTDTRHQSAPICFIVLRDKLENFIYPLLIDLSTSAKTVECMVVKKQGDKVVYLNPGLYKIGGRFFFSLPLSTPNLPAARAVNGYTGIYYGVDYRGNKVIAALDSVSFTKWYLITKIDYKDALKALFSRRIMIVTIILMFIALISAVLFIRTNKQNYTILKLKNDNENKQLATLKHFEYLFKYANDMIMLTDLDGNILEANGKAENMYGYNYEELKAMNIYQLTPIEFQVLGKHMDNDPRIVDGVVYETVQINKSGEHFNVEISKRALTIDGKLYLQRIIRDISERKQAELDMIQAKQEVEYSDKVKTAILTNMSHEFRTPLNGILGFAEVLHNLNVSEQVNGITDLIEISGQRLMHALDALLILSQLESTRGPIQTNMLYHSISNIIVNITGMIKKIADIKGLVLKTDIAAEISTICDIRLLTIMITNLLDNAVKFTSKGTIYVTLSTTEILSTVSVKIAIKDEGIGIPEKHIKLMFDDFIQYSEGYSRSYEGNGIGLSIAYKIVKLLNGEISIKSEMGIGTEVTVLIPHLQPLIRNIQSDVIATQPPKPANKEITALIVEDNLVNTKLLILYLNGLVKKIDCAETGEAAIQMSKSKFYDIIFMDINLGGGMDGKEATKQIRKQKGYEHLPIIAVTGYTMIGDKEMLLGSGLSHYIGKPYSQKEIRDLMQDIFPSML